MRSIFLTLLFFSLPSNGNEPVFAKQSLSQGDSFLLAKQLEGLGKQIIPDPNDAKQLMYISGIQSKDNALQITCVRTRIAGSFTDAKCDIAMNSALSQQGITSFKIGAVGHVMIGELFESEDVANLKRVLQPFGRFSSVEKNLVVVNGKDVSLSRFQVSCVEAADTTGACSVFMFP